MTEFDQSLSRISKNLEQVVAEQAMQGPYAPQVTLTLGPRVSRAQFIAYTALYFQHKLNENAKGFAEERQHYHKLLKSLDERKTGEFYDCGFFGLPQGLGGWEKLQTRCDSLGLKAELVVGRPWSAKDSPFPIAYGISLESREKDFPVKLQIHRATIGRRTPDAPARERTL